MLPQTPVFFMNANAPPPPHPPPPQEPNQTPPKKIKKKKRIKKTTTKNKYSSTQCIDIINIILNFFQLKLVKFTKNEQNKNKKLCKHTMSLLKQDRRNNNTNSKQKLCKHTMSR